MNEHIKAVFDWIAVSTVAATILKIIPAIAALMSIVWYTLRIYQWFKDRKDGNE